MPEIKAEITKKPRLLLRIFLVTLLGLAITGALGYKKFLQIQEMTAQGSVAPPPINVVVAIAQSAQWNKRIKAIGTLHAYRGVDIASEVPGVVKSINFDSGQEVESGALLVQLDNRSELARLAAAKAKFEADNSQNERLLKLKDKDFVTNNDLDTQASLVNIARSQIGIAQAALEKKSISAPFSGKLGIRQIDVGEYITPGTPIVTLQSVDKLLLDFTLPESNFRDLSVGQSIQFKVRSYPERQFNGQVSAWNPVLDENTRNISIRAEVDNKLGELAPGMFAEMEVTGKRKILVFTIPETSIFYNIYGEAVYALERPEATESDPDPAYILAARQVKVAYRLDGIVGITDGISAGDLIVTAGQLKLYPSLRVNIVDDVPEYNRPTSTGQ